MPALYFPFTLRVYTHALRCLGDGNFTGTDLFYRIKDCWKRRDTPHDLLLRPLERGLPFKIGEWTFATIFGGISESMAKPYFEQLDHEDAIWFLEEFIEAARLSELFKETGFLDEMAEVINAVGTLYQSNEEEYWRQLRGGSYKRLKRMFIKACEDWQALISEMGQVYALEIADRILHDRQLCNFIAQRVMEIGFDGETVDGLRAQWVQRERWREQIKAILRARDRGRCAACGVDIVQELREEGHIDHMFPIAQGGCNDLVNLQLLCSRCNLTKSDSAAGVTNSVPQYIRRPRKKIER